MVFPTSVARPIATASICPECRLLEQTSEKQSIDATQIEFLTNPKPFTPDGRALSGKWQQEF
jgi:hypothetical protein